MQDASGALQLLQIAHFAKDWPELRPLHDSAMETLVTMAREHAEAAVKRKQAAAEKAAETHKVQENEDEHKSTRSAARR